MSFEHIPPRIALVGLMGSGKSRVGERLADRLGYPCLDLDAEIEKAAGVSVSAIFAAEGESGFRDRESLLLASLASSEGPLVLAAGGGVVLRAENRRRLRADFVTVWIHGPLEVLATRVERNRSRPLLAGRPALEVLGDQDAERHALYAEVSRYRITTAAGEPADARAGEILELLRGGSAS